MALVSSTRPIAGPVYVLRWALTRGILVYPGGRVVDEKYFVGGTHCTDPSYCCVGPKDWTTDRAIAVTSVKAKAERKLQAIEKQHSALEAVSHGLTIHFKVW